MKLRVENSEAKRKTKIIWRTNERMSCILEKIKKTETSLVKLTKWWFKLVKLEKKQETFRESEGYA